MLFDTGWKSLVCAGLLLVALRLLRRRSAAERSLLANLGLVAILLLPIGAQALPDLPVAAPPAVNQVFAQVGPLPARAPAPTLEAEAPSPPPATEPALPPSAYGWREMVLLAWALPAAAMLLLTLLAVVRLHRLRARAQVLVDPRWLTALASAQRRLGLKHGTALLTSGEVCSPISWGIVRPIIVLDPHVAQDVGRAEAIIAHELAHVARLDWLALLLGRAAAAIFWFNPLVWMLAREAQDLSEQAADDVVLRSNVPSTDYADLLVGSARHAAAPMLLAANGVAPSHHSLGRRILNILDPTRSRIPVRLGWSALCLASTMGMGSALAAVEPCFSNEIPVLPVRSAPVAQVDYGNQAVAALTDIPLPQTQAIARAIARQDWDSRRAGDGTLFDDRRAVAPLLLALRDDSATTRRIAVWGLSEIRPPEAVEPLAALLGDPSPKVRAEAASALGDLGATDHALAIARLLTDPERAVRIEAAHALGDLADPAARPALETALEDSDRTVRSKAKWALRQIGEEEARPSRRSG
jgi:beta-lactamase regulating signal transducer with metallopeptidase domain